MAEIELNVLTGQCLKRRIDDINIVKKEVAAWQNARNNKGAKVNWQFTTGCARVKLHRLYPSLDVWHVTTLINRKGELLAYGAIISSRPRGSEGARSAAALKLSNNGFVIKVSADEPIALYEGGREIVEV